MKSLVNESQYWCVYAPNAFENNDLVTTSLRHIYSISCPFTCTTGCYCSLLDVIPLILLEKEKQNSTKKNPSQLQYINIYWEQIVFLLVKQTTNQPNILEVKYSKCIMEKK